MNNAWFIKHRKNCNVSRRIFCFPYAGGNAATYSEWGSMLSEDIEVIAVQLPGRSSRLFELPFDNMASLVDALLPQIIPLLDKPYIVFGHSLGSRVGYELLSQLQLRNQPMPDCFIASGSRAAHLNDTSDRCWSHDDATFIQVLKELKGTPPEIFDNNELLTLLLPMLRADFKISGTYQAKPMKLSCPIQILHGTDDTEVTLDQLNAWQSLTTKSIEIHSISGDHFFIDSNKIDTLNHINRVINKSTQRRMSTNMATE